jgi:peroxiredoxin
MTTCSSLHFPRLKFRRAVTGFVLTIGLVLVAGAEPLGVKAKVPDSTVFSVTGAPVKLRELVQQQPAVIIFYRGGWCPFCNRHLAALAKAKDDIRAAGFQLLAISADQSAKLAETPNYEQLGYTLLSDSSMEAAKAFGLTFEVPAETVVRYKRDHQIDLEAASGAKHHLLPHPSVFITDLDGIIRFAYVNPDYKTRLSPQDILAAIRSVAKPSR